jgi:hypothetical protein
MSPITKEGMQEYFEKMLMVIGDIADASLGDWSAKWDQFYEALSVMTGLDLYSMGVVEEHKVVPWLKDYTTADYTTGVTSLYTLYDEWCKAGGKFEKSSDNRRK